MIMKWQIESSYNSFITLLGVMLHLKVGKQTYVDTHSTGYEVFSLYISTKIVEYLL